jgi:hypothetical protein
MIQSSFRATSAKAGGDPESRNFKGNWILVSAGMTIRPKQLSHVISFGLVA